MKFLVHVDEEKVKELEKEREQQEYLATTKVYQFRLYDGEPFRVNVPENCSWQKLRELLAAEAQISPDWILHLVLVDEEGDELSPPLNNEEKFWRFGRNVTDNVGDVFCIHVDEEKVAAFEKEQARESGDLHGRNPLIFVSWSGVRIHQSYRIISHREPSFIHRHGSSHGSTPL